MEEIILPQFPRGHSNRPPQDAPPKPPTGRLMLCFLLLLTCLALGALGNWAWQEHSEKTRLSQLNYEIGNRYTFVLAKRNDLANLLTDPRTQVYRLRGQGQAEGRSASIAWRQDSRDGFLVATDMPLLPQGQGYLVWQIADGLSTPGVFFHSDPATTCIDFRCIPAVGKATGFLVTVEVGPDAATPSKNVVYKSSGEGTPAGRP